MKYNISNLLTLFRIFIIPIILIAILMKGPLSSYLAFLFFCIAGISDFFDGYFARIWKEQTNFGTFLDPIADKLLVASVILILTSIGTINGWTTIPALIILLREITVSGLREFLAKIEVSVPVSHIAKFKTMLQMVALALLILSQSNLDFALILYLGKYALWIAAILTLYTGYDYMRSAIKHIN